MESAEMEAIVRGRLAEVEAGIRKIVETARRRIRPMADTPDDGRRSIRHEVCDLTWLAGELARPSLNWQATPPQSRNPTTRTEQRRRK